MPSGTARSRHAMITSESVPFLLLELPFSMVVSFPGGFNMAPGQAGCQQAQTPPVEQSLQRKSLMWPEKVKSVIRQLQGTVVSMALPGRQFWSWLYKWSRFGSPWDHRLSTPKGGIYPNVGGQPPVSPLILNTLKGRSSSESDPQCPGNITILVLFFLSESLALWRKKLQLCWAEQSSTGSGAGRLTVCPQVPKGVRIGPESLLHPAGFSSTDL
jgi:hypothetical protein